jgi:hypothetical protein
MEFWMAIKKRPYYGMGNSDKIWLGRKSARFRLRSDQAVALAIALMKAVGSKRKTLFVTTHFMKEGKERATITVHG